MSVTAKKLGSSGGLTSWQIDHDTVGFTTAIGTDLSAMDLRAIADVLEEIEMKKLREVWSEEAHAAWRKTYSENVPTWYLAGWVDAKEQVYRG